MEDNTPALCEHVYKEMGVDICHLCNIPTHRINWEKQNKLHQEWIASGKARYLGWVSI